ncbi:hypothetical protein MIMGU_mgv1a022396mg, partial [Erythranthe guttata]
FNFYLNFCSSFGKKKKRMLFHKKPPLNFEVLMDEVSVGAPMQKF